MIIKLKRPQVDFDSTAITPHTWRNVSHQLLEGAKLLWQPIAEGIQGFGSTRGARTPDQAAGFEKQIAYYRPFFVLAGFAVENKLKAVIVHREIAAGSPPKTAKEVLKLFPRGKQHDLVALARCAGITLSSADETILERLTHFVRWAGRYPIPLTASETTFERTTRECDLEDILRLMQILEREFWSSDPEKPAVNRIDSPSRHSARIPAHRGAKMRSRSFTYATS
jgi:hypothetical protein